MVSGGVIWCQVVLYVWCQIVSGDDMMSGGVRWYHVAQPSHTIFS